MLISEVPAFREYWYPIAYDHEIGTEPYPFRMFGDDYVAWRAEPGAAVHAAVDECPHRSARLSQGWIEGGCLVCPYHGWRFAGDGACVEIPSNAPEVPIPPRAHVQSVLADEKYGLVWVCVGVPREPIPALKELDEGYTLVHEMFETWAACAPRIVDNALDVSHVAWVHRNSVGTSDAPRLGEFDVQRKGAHLAFSVTITARVNEQQKANTGITSDFTERTTYAELVQPFVFRGLLRYEENGLEHVLYKTCTPIDDRHTKFCQFIARSDHPDEAKQQGIVAIDRRVQSEDRALLEGVRPDFPLEITTEVHVKSDRMTLEYRKVLAELAGETTGVTPDAEWARRW